MWRACDDEVWKLVVLWAVRVRESESERPFVGVFWMGRLGVCRQRLQGPGGMSFDMQPCGSSACEHVIGVAISRAAACVREMVME